MTKQIPLSKGHFAIVDDEDYERTSQHKWCYSKGYAIRRAGRRGSQRLIPLHRFILNAPEGLDVDHVNGDKLDNRRCNLRLASRSQNAANSGPRAGTSKYKGVSWLKSRRCWKASIGVNYKYSTIGQFDNEVAAAIAYDKAALAAFGEFAYLNFPELVR